MAIPLPCDCCDFPDRIPQLAFKFRTVIYEDPKCGFLAYLPDEDGLYKRYKTLKITNRVSDIDQQIADFTLNFYVTDDEGVTHIDGTFRTICDTTDDTTIDAVRIRHSEPNEEQGPDNPDDCIKTDEAPTCNGGRTITEIGSEITTYPDTSSTSTHVITTGLNLDCTLADESATETCEGTDENGDPIEDACFCPGPEGDEFNPIPPKNPDTFSTTPKPDTTVDKKYIRWHSNTQTYNGPVVTGSHVVENHTLEELSEPLDTADDKSLVDQAIDHLPDEFSTGGLVIDPPNSSVKIIDDDKIVYLQEMTYRIVHTVTRTCYLKVWLRSRFHPIDALALDDDSNDIVTDIEEIYEWEAFGNPCLAEPDKGVGGIRDSEIIDGVDQGVLIYAGSIPLKGNENVIFGPEAVMPYPEEDGTMSIEIKKYSFVKDYEPADPDEHYPVGPLIGEVLQVSLIGNRPDPDPAPNGAPGLWPLR